MIPMANNIYEGCYVKRFGEMPGFKQENLAFDLRDDLTQKKTSLLEAKKSLEPALLLQISTVFKIPIEAFHSFDEEAVVNFINNTFDYRAIRYARAVVQNFNPRRKDCTLRKGVEEKYEAEK